MTWYLYLIECAGGRIYTGVTVNVAARYQAHLSGKGARYTRAFPPQRLLASQTFSNRSAAQQAEFQIKRLSAAAKRAYCIDLNQLPQEGAEGETSVAKTG